VVEMMDIHFFPGNGDNLPFSKIKKFSITTDYDDDALFFLNDGIH
jgi:hypothetical protein